MKKPGSGRRDYDLTRCRQAYELHVGGMNLIEVAETMNVAHQRASIMVRTYEQHLLLLETIADLQEYRNS